MKKEKEYKTGINRQQSDKRHISINHKPSLSSSSTSLLSTLTSTTTTTTTSTLTARRNV